MKRLPADLAGEAVTSLASEHWVLCDMSLGTPLPADHGVLTLRSASKSVMKLEDLTSLSLSQVCHRLGKDHPFVAFWSNDTHVIAYQVDPYSRFIHPRENDPNGPHEDLMFSIMPPSSGFYNLVETRRFSISDAVTALVTGVIPTKPESRHRVRVGHAWPLPVGPIIAEYVDYDGVVWQYEPDLNPTWVVASDEYQTVAPAGTVALARERYGL